MDSRREKNAQVFVCVCLLFINILSGSIAISVDEHFLLREIPHFRPDVFLILNFAKVNILANTF